MNFKKRFLNILFWSVISAAFIGPGTITTAAKSGAMFGMQLLWALLFSTLACLLLQEAAARIPIISGKNLGQAIAQQFEKSKFKWPVLLWVLGAIVVGAAAYETGNLLGSIAGMKLFSSLPSYLLILIVGAIAATILAIPSLKIISTIMGFAVVIMGIVFLVTAFTIAPPLSEMLTGIFIPKIPDNSRAGLLVLGLIGTTIVPYNLFLGSGISGKEHNLKEMRFGLIIAVVLGGIFSMAVLVVGSSVTGEFSFENLSLALQQKMGIAGKYMLGVGLFAAGFTSSITAPLASAITLKSILGNKHPEKWHVSSLNFRLGWIVILLTGIGFALINVKPIPAIIMAQALNGFLLPFVAIFLYMVLNNQELMGTENTNKIWMNVLTLLVIFITLVLGLNNVAKATLALFSKFESGKFFQISIVIVAAVLSLGIGYYTFRKKKVTNMK
ncbi:MAG: divalent metal cation transporter [Prolixibacteraceae bacterium]|nr:divalent metal cation transporter [Prolixibacteraceae bacterium]